MMIPFYSRPASIPHIMGVLSPLGILVLCSLAFQVSTLRCVQCNSLDDPKCTDGDVSPRQCPSVIADAQYCMKSVGEEVDGRGHFVFRSCSRVHESHNCTQSVHDGVVYTECRTTCAHDGCNGVDPVVSLFTTKSIMTIFLTLLISLHSCLT